MISASEKDRLITVQYQERSPLPENYRNFTVADVMVILGSIDIVMGEVDR